MSTLKAFQLRTSDRVVSTLSDGSGSRRFLVADEVGLGKTIVARDVIARMAVTIRKKHKRPMRVFYLCSSLSIASQNRKQLLKPPKGATRVPESTPVDRLTLVPTRKALPHHALFHLYTLTAGTSFPDRRGRSRGGTGPERALLHNLLQRTHRPSVKRDWLRRGITKENWPKYLGKKDVKPKRSLLDLFRAELLRKWGLRRRNEVAKAVRERLGRYDGTLLLIGELRTLLARIALKSVAPDVIVFDEFQRFRDLMSSSGEDAGRVANILVDPPDGARPGVLLLSATPYKAFDSQFEDAFGDRPHHEQLLELMGWLAGGGDKGQRYEDKIGRA
jgi:hypothetical protein